MRPTLKNLPENLSADALKVKDPHCRENQRCNNGRCFWCSAPEPPPPSEIPLWGSREIAEYDNQLLLHCNNVHDVTVRGSGHDCACVLFSLCLDYDVLCDVEMLSQCPGFCVFFFIYRSSAIGRSSYPLDWWGQAEGGQAQDLPLLKVVVLYKIKKEWKNKTTAEWKNSNST